MPAIADTLDRRARGAAIEAAAREYLEREGLRPLAANARYKAGELDLVMLDRDRDRDRDRGGGCDVVVFVEVRYRQHAGYGGGAASIDRNKRRRLVRAALLFLARHRALADAPCRFDVVEASGDPDAPSLTWLRDAFRADDA